jgi:hypothetical protein
MAVLLPSFKHIHHCSTEVAEEVRHLSETRIGYLQLRKVKVATDPSMSYNFDPYSCLLPSARTFALSHVACRLEATAREEPQPALHETPSHPHPFLFLSGLSGSDVGRTYHPTPTSRAG